MKDIIFFADTIKVIVQSENPNLYLAKQYIDKLIIMIECKNQHDRYKCKVVEYESHLDYERDLDSTKRCMSGNIVTYKREDGMRFVLKSLYSQNDIAVSEDEYQSLVLNVIESESNIITP